MNNNTKGMENAFKAGVWYIISTMLVKSIAIVSTPLYTRMMSTSDYGIAATFNTWYALLSIICSLNVGYSIGRAKVDFKTEFNSYITNLQVICSVVTGAIFFVIFIFFDPLQNVIGLDKTSVFLLFLYVLFGTIVSVYQGKYRFSYQYKQNIAISIFVSVSTVAFSLILIGIMPQKYLGKIIGTVLPVAFLGVFLWLTSFKNGQFKIQAKYCKYALAFSVPLIVHSLSIYVLGQSDRLMIRYFCGDDAVGIYSLIYQYAILVSLITNAINQAWNPWFHDNYALKNFGLIKSKIVPLLVLGGYIGIGCVAIAPEAIRLLGGEKYLGGLNAVLPIAMGVVLEFVYTQYVIIEMHLKKTKYVSIGTGIAAIINLVLNYLLSPRYGYSAAAYTTLFSYFILLLLHHYITRFKLKVHLYRDGQIYGIVFIMGILATLFAGIYEFVVLRYVLLIIVSLFFLVYNKEFIANKIWGNRLEKF